MIHFAIVVVPKGDDGWPLEDVAGLTHIDRTLMELRAAGIDSVHLCCDPETLKHLRLHIARCAVDQRLPAVYLHDQSAPTALQVPGLALLMDGRRVYHQELLRNAVSQNAEVAYLTDHGEPAGIRVVSQRSFDDAAPFESFQTVQIPDGTFAQPADSPQARKVAERLIFRSLIKPNDGWFSVHLNRPISTRISKILVRYSIHPNMVTMFSILVAIASGAFSTMGTYFGFAIGGVLFQLYSVLDGVDGEIARVKHLCSRTGQWLDSTADHVSNVLYFACVTIGVYRALGSVLLLEVGIAVVALNIMALSIMFWQLATQFNSGSMLGYQWDIKKPENRDRPLNKFLLSLEPFMRQDCYSLSFMVMALAGMAWLILPTALVAFSIYLTVILTQTVRRFLVARRRRRTPSMSARHLP
jgi:phosphatidylglycerophosphate synthase